MAKRKNVENYEVGYGKPPVAGQAKKGEVKNPWGSKGKNGQTKIPEDFAAEIVTLWKMLASKKRKVTIDGKTQWMGQLELVLTQMFNDAIKGDSKARRDMQLWQRQFPALIETPIKPVGSIRYEFPPTSPEVVLRITMEQFMKAHPETPEDDLPVLRKYFPPKLEGQRYYWEEARTFGPRPGSPGAD